MYFQVLTVGVIGPVLLVTDSIDFHYMAQYISKPVKFYAWAWSMYALMALPLSMVMINTLLKVNVKALLDEYVSKELSEASSKSSLKFNLSLLALSSLSLIYILYYSPTIPIIDLIQSGDFSEAASDRIESKYGFSGVIYLKSFFGLILIPCCSYYFYVIAFKSKRSVDWLIFGIQFLLAFTLLVYDLQKSPLAFYLFGFIILHTFITNGINPRWFSAIMGIAFAVILIGYKNTTGVTIESQIFNYQSAFYGRIFLSGFLGFPLSLELFPDKINSITTLFGVPNPILELYQLDASDPARNIMFYINESGAREGSSNLVSGYYMGEAWASFRYAGLVIAPFIVGALLQITHIGLLKLPKDPLYIAFYAYISTKWLIASGFSSFLTLKVLLFPLLVLTIIILTKNSIKNTITNNG